MWARKYIFSSINFTNIPGTLSIVGTIRKIKFRNLRINNLDIPCKNWIFTVVDQERNIITAVFQEDNAAKRGNGFKREMIMDSKITEGN